MYQEFLDIGLHAVAEAEKIINKYASPDIRVTLKPDQSPVTLADQEAEQVIVQTISQAFLAHTFLAEESATMSPPSEWQWIIDPIDGTNSYIMGIPLYATQLALMHNGEIVVGISNNPALHELMYATKGGGAYLNGKQIKVSTVPKINQAVVSHGSVRTFKTLGKRDQLDRYSEGSRTSRGFGDFWGHQLVAEGKLAAMVEAKVKIWDIAAMTLIVPEAGGKVTDMHGNLITRESTSVVSTNGLVHNEVVDMFK